MSLSEREVYSWFYELVSRHSRIPRDNVIHVGEVSGCLRRAFFDRRNPLKKVDAQNVILTIGNSVHLQLQEILREKGFQVEVEAAYPLRGFTLVGHADLYDPLRNIIIELKTVTKIPKKPYQEHILQVNAYTFMLKAERAFIVYISKSNGAIRVFEIGRNPRLWRYTIKRAFTLHNALSDNKPPEPERSHFCSYCPYKWRCYGSDM